MLLFFFNDPAPTVIYTLSLHDALPISTHQDWPPQNAEEAVQAASGLKFWSVVSLKHKRSASVNMTKEDRKSTRLNSSHQIISYAVFCLKKKKSSSRLFRTVFGITSYSS